MPRELRHLLFRTSEVVQAVKEYHRRIGNPLPAGAVARCGPEAADATVRFRIILNPDRVLASDGSLVDAIVEERQELLIEGPTLAAALILHCRDRKIPLPAGADKSLQRFGEQVCLIVTLNPKLEDMPSTDELRL